MKVDALPKPTAVIPHRKPFLYVDEITYCDQTSVVGRYRFGDEPFFEGHFPGNPVVPGVILVEGLAQTLAYLAIREVGGDTVLLTGIDGCKIRRPVLPGDEVTYRVEVLKHKLKMVVAKGVVEVAGETSVTVTLKGYSRSSATT